MVPTLEKKSYILNEEPLKTFSEQNENEQDNKSIIFIKQFPYSKNGNIILENSIKQKIDNIHLFETINFGEISGRLLTEGNENYEKDKNYKNENVESSDNNALNEQYFFKKSINNLHQESMNKLKNLKYIQNKEISSKKIVNNEKNLSIENNYSSLNQNSDTTQEGNEIKYKYKCEHPGCRNTFKTKKLKTNRHDFSDKLCKDDTLLLLNTIKEVVSIIVENQNLKLKMKRKRKYRKYFKQCVNDIPHSDYSIHILGKDITNNLGIK